jgi:phenylacetate-CoA ligase
MADPRLPTRLGVQVVIDERRGETIERFWRFLSELRPAVVTVKPSLLEALVAKAERTAPRPSCSPDLVLSSGALLSDALRKEAEALFGSAVTNAYGMTEFGLMAAECEHRAGLHVDESALAVEQVEGELVVSSVSNRAMPLVRYRTADLGVLARGRCRCGRTTTRLRALSGRRVRSFRLDSEELLSPARFNRLFEHPALREFQLTQVAPLQFELSVELEPNCDPCQVLPAVERDARLIFDREVDLRLRLGGLEKEGKFERYRCAF